MVEENFKTFTAWLVNAVAGEPFNLKIEIGADRIAANTPPPKVIFVLDPHERITDQKGFGGTGALGAPNPKILFTRVISFDAHIWGRTRTEAERLIGFVTNAIYDAAWGSVNPVSGDWQSEKSINSLGNYYILHTELWIPITRPAATTVTGVEFPITPADPMAVS